MTDTSGAQGVFQRCRECLEDVVKEGLLMNCLKGEPQKDSSASKMEWVGDTALLLEVRRAISEVSDMALEERDMARLSEMCISNKGLHKDQATFQIFSPVFRTFWFV